MLMLGTEQTVTVIWEREEWEWRVEEEEEGKRDERPHLKLKLERYVAVDLEEMVEGEGDGRYHGTKEEELHGSKIRLHVAEQVHSETTL